MARRFELVVLARIESEGEMTNYGTDDRARQFAYEAISRCRHTHPAEHALDESGACVDCITEAINAALTTAERQRDELLAAIDKALICVQNGDCAEAGWYLYDAIARARKAGEQED